MTRINTIPPPHTSPKVSVKTELTSFQNKIFTSATDIKSVSAPKNLKDATATIPCTPKGMVDAGATAYQIGGKLYVATADFRGKTSWFEAPASDSKKLATLQKDIYGAAQSVPAKSWSKTAPAGADDMSKLPVTPKGLMGVGTSALIARDGSVWVERQVVAPNAKPEYAKIS